MNELEELNLDGLDLEEIKRFMGGYPFPAITAARDYFYCNKPFSNLLTAKGYNYIKFYITPDYVILSPSSEVVENGYKISHSHGNVDWDVLTVKLPASMKEKKIRTGVFKIYKCKQGYAFKRYEPLTERIYR